MNPKQIVDVTTGGASAVNTTPFPGFPPLQKVNDICADLVEKYRVGVFDPKAGEKLMQDAGYARDGEKFWAKDGKRAGGDIHGLGILVNQIGPLVQQQLRRAGFEVTFYSTPDSSRIMATAQCPLMLSGQAGSSILDPLATRWRSTTARISTRSGWPPTTTRTRATLSTTRRSIRSCR